MRPSAGYPHLNQLKIDINIPTKTEISGGLQAFTAVSRKHAQRAQVIVTILHFRIFSWRGLVIETNPLSDRPAEFRGEKGTMQEVRRTVDCRAKRGLFQSDHSVQQGRLNSIC